MLEHPAPVQSALNSEKPPGRHHTEIAARHGPANMPSTRHQLPRPPRQAFQPKSSIAMLATHRRRTTTNAINRHAPILRWIVHLAGQVCFIPAAIVQQNKDHAHYPASTSQLPSSGPELSASTTAFASTGSATTAAPITPQYGEPSDCERFSRLIAQSRALFSAAKRPPPKTSKQTTPNCPAGHLIAGHTHHNELHAAHEASETYPAPMQTSARTPGPRLACKELVLTPAMRRG